MFFDTCKKQRNGHKRNYNGYYPTVLKTIFLNKHSVWVGGAVASWLVSRTLERTGFEPWSGTMWENLTNYGKVTHDGLASCQGEVEILQAASCYRNLDKLRQLWTSRLAPRVHSLKVPWCQVFHLCVIKCLLHNSGSRPEYPLFSCIKRNLCQKSFEFASLRNEQGLWERSWLPSLLRHFAAFPTPPPPPPSNLVLWVSGNGVDCCPFCATSPSLSPLLCARVDAPFIHLPHCHCERWGFLFRTAVN